MSRLSLVALLLLGAVSARATSPVREPQPLLPRPTGSGPDQLMADLAAGFQLQQDIWAAAETGLSLDVFVNPADVELVKSFFAGGADRDFQQLTGRTPFSVVATFHEYGDEGNFAGVATVGVAARLMVLQRENAPAAEIAKARTAAIRAARAWHVYGAIAGNGIIARGVRRIRPENSASGELPPTIPMLTPLRDEQGNPLPVEKVGTWRAPVAPGFDDWIWMDETSKDQVVGYALACAWLHDALHDDPEVPDDVLGDLAADMKQFIAALRVIQPETGLDLTLRDADGRLTGAHDLNARELLPGLVVPELEEGRNGFNATLALAIVRAAYQVSGDEDIGRWYYEDLVKQRDYPALTALNPGLIFMGTKTNFSNVNMLAIAWATLARFETNPAVRTTLQEGIEHAFWDTGSRYDCLHTKQAWFDAVYASFAPHADVDTIAARITDQLTGFSPAPAFERDMQNCDEAELAEGVCIGVDGTTVIHTSSGSGHGGGSVATEIVPQKIRPDSDFLWRDDPFNYNGQASTLMDPRGDYLAAYWLARLVDRDGTRNVSPNARKWPEVEPKKATQAGCRCDAMEWPGLVAVLGLFGARRRSGVMRRELGA